MATTPRQRNPRSIRMFDVSGDRDDDIAVALPNGTSVIYSRPMYGPDASSDWAFELIWSAGNTGTFELQYSMKGNPELSNDNDWVPATGHTVIGSAFAVAGAAGKCVVFHPGVMVEWFRIKYTNASGSGSLVQGYARVAFV